MRDKEIAVDDDVVRLQTSILHLYFPYDYVPTMLY